MSATHTPGPWVADAVNAWPEQIGCCPLVGKPYSISHNSINVAAATTPANAQLIAAAPTMYEALKGIVAMWDHHCYAHGDGQPTPLHVKARAAIARAEGR